MRRRSQHERSPSTRSTGSAEGQSRPAGADHRRRGRGWHVRGSRPEPSVQRYPAFAAERRWISCARSALDHVIDYAREDFIDEVTRYDLIVDTAGNRPLHTASPGAHERGTASRARARGTDVALPRAWAGDPGTSPAGHAQCVDLISTRTVAAPGRSCSRSQSRLFFTSLVPPWAVAPGCCESWEHDAR
jgi:hypothetical protein